MIVKQDWSWYNDQHLCTYLRWLTIISLQTLKYIGLCTVST